MSPYEVNDPAQNEGFVNVGRDHDTVASFVARIRSGWPEMENRAYPNATELFITTDGRAAIVRILECRRRS